VGRIEWHLEGLGLDCGAVVCRRIHELDAQRGDALAVEPQVLLRLAPGAILIGDDAL
jgi:hypothetical protein